MKILQLSVLLGCLVFPYCATAQEWRSECVGYYQLQLPDNLEVALLPVDLIINPRKNPAWTKNEFVRRYLFPKISFGNNRYQDNNDRTQAQFSGFYYSDYEIGVSSDSKSEINLGNYKNKFEERANDHIQDYWDERNYELSLKLPVLSKEIAEQSLMYSIDNYTDAFSSADSGGYSLFINKNRRLYIFNKTSEAQSLAEQLKISKPEVLSLLNRFRPRKLYEVPAEQGFCMPYGFVARDSGQEPRNMGVTYRLKDHPDVTIFFQDLGMEPNAGKESELNDKDYVTWLWNWQYQWSAVSKELIRPKWRSIKMGGKEGLGTFAKSVFKNGRTDYGYVAYVRGNHKARNLEPDLLFYVMQDSRQAKNQPPMDKDELKKMAEHIISSVKRR
ncbi:T6SS immunity protein Tli4 family protein [Buttiauxella ferragutiae]|uniref:T6SS immunity protein Tli4 family protein n=1 Tax=Buttiauxella ferragutiae TaxID=82989 RepID=UPI001F530980|nr:T6SS immunity protein Tli4 family protein [Buttiauxella ferragutiae]UNK63185.1 T6SS immunity protein Tli4 family protein [Buttiauxella ferragutiae]